MRRRIVLDTNCLLVSISKYGEAYPVWRGFLDGRFTLCVSTFAAVATYIVSDDSHFNILRDITFPQLLVLRLKEFLESLQKEDL